MHDDVNPAPPSVQPSQGPGPKNRRPRGRPPASPKEIRATRARIAASAHKLFLQEGYRSVTMRRLAQEVGCTPMALYGYFSGKAEILQTLWSEILSDLFARISEVRDDHPEQRLLRLARTYLSYWLDNPDHYRVLFMTEGVTQTEVSQFLDEEASLVGIGLFRDVMAVLMPGEADLRLRNDFLMCALQGIAHCHITMGGYGWSSPDLLADRAVIAAIA